MKTCCICQKEIIPPKGYGEPGYTGGTGYAESPDGLVCWSCCGYQDRACLMGEDRAVLYLEHKDRETVGIVTNWPGTFSVPCAVKTGRHNIAGRKYSVRFTVGGRQWFGVCYGDNTQLLHCKAIKA